MGAPAPRPAPPAAARAAPSGAPIESPQSPSIFGAVRAPRTSTDLRIVNGNTRDRSVDRSADASSDAADKGNAPRPPAGRATRPPARRATGRGCFSFFGVRGRRRRWRCARAPVAGATLGIKFPLSFHSRIRYPSEVRIYVVPAEVGSTALCTRRAALGAGGAGGAGRAGLKLFLFESRSRGWTRRPRLSCGGFLGVLAVVRVKAVLGGVDAPPGPVSTARARTARPAAELTIAFDVSPPWVGARRGLRLPLD
ncbi:hypothetical protein EVAR_21386_1 [Eumeta japonica]|uniref:Uncharacterized protein n=1 Tax=Eumeta variegata TaxID=151549 RepID=A0A4C1VHA1_EUMVA|nr:hypothetical protein EVAR_21386_1 [Eumeta japonica]